MDETVTDLNLARKKVITIIPTSRLLRNFLVICLNFLKFMSQLVSLIVVHKTVLVYLVISCEGLVELVKVKVRNVDHLIWVKFLNFEVPLCH